MEENIMEIVGEGRAYDVCWIVGGGDDETTCDT